MTLLMAAACLTVGGMAQQSTATGDERPTLLTPDEMPEVWDEADAGLMQTLPVEDAWWQAFGDPTLDSLIRLTMSRNLSAEAALRRIEQARAAWRTKQGALLPSIGLSGGWTRRQTSGNSTGASRSWSGQFDLTASMQWEVDLFGSIRQGVKAGREQYRASEEEYRGLMVSLCAEVATAYFNLRQYQQEWEVLDHNCRSQQAVVSLTEARNQSGLASKLDVAQARQVYYGTLAQLPAVEASIDGVKNRLSLLLGLFPGEADGWLSEAKPLPEFVEVVGVDVPASLLRRRPDIRQAERQVAAQASLLGVAKREWLPRFFLDGQVGYASAELRELPRAGSVAWQIAPSVSWTLFNGGRRTAAIRQSRAELDEAITQYNQTVLTAMQEVASAMSTYTHSLKQIVATRQAFVQSQAALALSLDLYKQGLTTFQSVLDAQRSLLSYEESLVQVQGASLVGLVRLYQALGGNSPLQLPQR